MYRYGEDDSQPGRVQGSRLLKALFEHQQIQERRVFHVLDGEEGRRKIVVRLQGADSGLAQISQDGVLRAIPNRAVGKSYFAGFDALQTSIPVDQTNAKLPIRRRRAIARDGSRCGSGDQNFLTVALEPNVEPRNLPGVAR